MNGSISDSLKARIANLIAVQGPISVAQYMTMALHDPLAGYYATRQPFGRSGDFITAPEISQMFGEMLGLWCVTVWAGQGKPKKKTLVELGPGRGTLMADVLRAARIAPDFLDGLDVVLVESSPALQKLQAENLKACSVPIRWTAQFEGSGQPLFLLANEFFDALPIRQYVRTERGWCERMVTAKEGTLGFALAPTPSMMMPEAPQGGVCEVSSAAIALMEMIGKEVATQGGAALLLDYGYGPDAGYGETLQAVGGHEFADLLTEPGLHDLSAHVDFAALARAAQQDGAKVFGPRGQGEFLLALGIAARAEQLMAANPKEAKDVGATLARLTEAGQMGTLFKAMALLPPSAPPPPGFAP